MYYVIINQYILVVCLYVPDVGVAITNLWAVCKNHHLRLSFLSKFLRLYLCKTTHDSIQVTKRENNDKLIYYRIEESHGK